MIGSAPIVIYFMICENWHLLVFIIDKIHVLLSELINPDIFQDVIGEY
jgi:hypothetical protein